MARNSKRKLPFMTEFFMMLLLSILLFSVVTTYSSAQTNLDQETMSEVEKATDLINDNEILKIWQNESTQIGVGTVQNVTCKYDETGALMTYADILVDVPLTDNIYTKQVITTKYAGGKIGDSIIICYMYWSLFPNDKIVPPSVFELSEEMSVMFFVEEKTRLLKGYILYSTDNADQSERAAEPDGYKNPYPVTNTASQMSLSILLSEPQPTTQHVQEWHYYGYTWHGYRMSWSDMPEPYHIDPDGTPDIPGSDEFNAIHASFATWENDPHSGIDFTYGGTKDYDNSWVAYDQPIDGYSVVGWAPDIADAIMAQTYIKPDYYSGFYHIAEADIVLNDKKPWVLSDPYWPFRADVQAVLTHEIGHYVGLGHVEAWYNTEQTMYADYDWSINQRTLEWGDLNGAHYVYPVHNDAGSGGDGANDFNSATFVDRTELYSGHLCHDLWPVHTSDSEDNFKFYATATMWVYITLDVPDTADFNIELRDPNNNVVAYSRQNGDGIDEVINQNPMGASGYWRIRIYTDKTDRHGDGYYTFVIYDYYSRYVDSIEWAGPLSGQGGVDEPNGMIGTSPNDYAAVVYAMYNVGDAGAIVGHLNWQVEGTSDIYIYGGVPIGYDAHVLVYVSQNAYYDWEEVADTVIYGTAEPTTLHFGPVYSTYRYVCVVVFADYWVPQLFFIDCVIVNIQVA